jgi:hypothetical protein
MKAKFKRVIIHSADWWVLTNANAAGTNDLTCFPKHRGALNITFLFIHFGFDSRTVQTFVCMNMSVCIGSGCFYV